MVIRRWCETAAGVGGGIFPAATVVLLDLNLPDGSGLDLLKKLTDAKLATR